MVLDFYGAEMSRPGRRAGGHGAGSPSGPRSSRTSRSKAVEQAEKTIRNRVDKWGVTEPDIKRKQNTQIQIQLPGFKDPGKAKDLLGRTAQLEFKIADDESPVLDAVRTELPPCPQGPDGGIALPAPRDRLLTSWSRSTCPAAVQRQATYVAASKRTELEAVIEQVAQARCIDPRPGDRHRRGGGRRRGS